jgi:hypothetical protein
MKTSMINLLSTFAVLVVISSPVLAEKGHDHVDNKAQPMGGMMSHEQMMLMHEHMQKMHSMMTKIKAETDLEKHQQLMQEHMQAMHEGMQKMNKGIGMQNGMKSSDHQGKGMSEKMGDKDMMERMDMMEERMNMMQMMMGQMMDHKSEAQKSPVHKHRK